MLAPLLLGGCADLCPEAGPVGGGGLLCPSPEIRQVLDDPPPPAPEAPEPEGTTDSATEEELPQLATRDPLPAPGPDPLAQQAIEGCTTYEELRCDAGREQRCAVYDPQQQSFVEPDPLFARALLYERWYDLYHSPDGLTAEREFREGIEPGTPESDWGSDALFSDFEGVGDSAIWTGAALNAAMLRYLEMPTAAERERVRDRTESLLHLFEVTGVEGYLARYHYLRPQQEDAGRSTDHIVRSDNPTHMEQPVTLHASWLSQSYMDTEGQLQAADPWWYGNPSIDQYSGALSTLPAAWALLDDDPELQQRILDQLSCYLNRLERIDIINLDTDEALQDSLASFLGGVVGLELDPEDPDISHPDEVVLYVLRQHNKLNAEGYGSCPEAPAREPGQVLDAAHDDFLLQLVALVSDLDATREASRTNIDHFYAPGVRGSDAIALINLSASLWHMTGDPIYESFLLDTLWEELDAVAVSHTLGALRLPRWCHAYFGDHIAATPLWAALNQLEDSELRQELARVMHEEAWLKQHIDLDNAKFNLLYSSSLDPSVGPDVDAARAAAAALIFNLGGNGGLLDDPRRNYTRAYEDVIAALPPGIQPVCPTEEERITCESPIELYGITLAEESITFECQENAGECLMSDGLCARTMADQALPVELRRFTDFLWQRSPYELGELYSVSGSTQSAGLDLIEAFWLARYDDALSEGEGQVLAWRDVGNCAI